MAREPKDSNENAEPAVDRPASERRSYAPETKLSELSLKDLSAILRAEISSVINSGLVPGGIAGAHVNSGPPGFVNGGGHANFDPSSLAGVHVNSGPPGFVNGGGHANFDPAASAGSHVNSGPPGFVNGGGHANFDPGSILNPGRSMTHVTLPGGLRVDLPARGAFDMTVRGTRIRR